MSTLLISLKDAWNNRATLNEHTRTKDELAFLPAALEIQETPPLNSTRWLGWSLIALFIIALIWATFGKVDIVATSEGKIIPSSRVKTIQPLEKAVIAAIHVKEGQQVKKGDVLVELDKALTNADQQRSQNELQSAESNHARLNAFYQRLNSGDETQNNLLASQALQLEQEWQQFKAQLDTLSAALLSQHAQAQASLDTIKKLQGTLPLITKRTESLKTLSDQKLAAETQYLELEEQRIQQQQDLAAEYKRHTSLKANQEETRQRMQQLTAETKAKTLGQMNDLERQMASLQEELNKATDLNKKQQLTAPVEGTVQQLAITTVGGVVTEAQPLMLIVPEEDQLEVQTMLPNQDIGFVHQGQEAEIKIHTFPFTKYGTIHAKVKTISDDAVQDEKLGLVYAVNLIMDKSTINVDGKTVKLQPGMAVTAEMKTGRRTIMEFFLSPIMQHGQESLRER